MPKLKTHKTAQKRFKVTGTGKLMRTKGGKSHLRRAHRPEDALTTVVTCGDLQIDFARRCVTVRGQRVSLTRTEYAVLHHLAIHRNKVVLHQELLTAVWGPEYRDDLEYLRAYVRHLRRKIEDDPSNPRYLINYPGVGYMLACPEA